MPLSQQQLMWRCRRGVRELDVLFERFVRAHYPTLSIELQDAFIRFTAEQDPVIMDWLFAKTEPEDPDYRSLIGIMRDQAGL